MGYISIKMDSYDLESNRKVIENQILNKVQSTYFQLGRGIEMMWPVTKITTVHRRNI